MMSFFRGFAETVARSAAQAGARDVERRAERRAPPDALLHRCAPRQGDRRHPGMVVDRLQELRRSWA